MRNYLLQLRTFFLCLLSIVHLSFSEDFVPPVFNSSSIINNTTGSQFTLRINVNQASTVFYVVSISDTNPNTTEIKAGQLGGGAPAPISGSFLATASTNTDEIISGLTAGTSYFINFFAENGDDEQSSVQEINATATDSTPPVINSSSIINVTDVQFTLRTNISENATVYYVVTSSGTAPSSAQIEAGTDENDDPALFSGSALATGGVNLDQVISGLSPTTEYHVHFFAKDASGNESAVDSETASTIVGTPTAGSFTSTTCVDNGTITFSAPASGLGFTYLVFVKPSSAITIGSPSQDPTTYAAPTTDLSNTTPTYENDANARLVYRGNSVPASINLTGLASNAGWATFHVAIFNVKDNTTYSPAHTFSGSRAAASTIGNISNYAAAPLNQSAQLSFDFPNTCFDQVMIVARSGSAPTMATPVGTSFTADADFTGGGTALNSGKVVYYSSGTPGANESFTVTGLTNGTTYHFRYFVRKGLVWFVGTSINTTPDVAPAITNLNPADNSTLMSLSFTNAIITFDVNIEAGSGGGSSGDNRRTARLYRASDDFLVEEVDRSSINFSGQTATIPFNETLTDNTSYYIQIGANTIRKSPGGTAFPGISDKTTWNFNVVLLQANAGPDRTICAGESTTLLGSAAGGTGFNSYIWSPSTGLSCTTCPNPTASPASTTIYTLTVDNNAGQGPVNDQVTVTVYPKPDVSFDPGTRTSFIVNEAPYLLSGIADPSDGTRVFSGTGVTLHGDGNYYFNPSSAGAQDDIPITYTHTNTNGCSNSITIEVDVSSESPILNLKSAYCSNESIDNSPSGVLAPNPAVINPTTYRYMRFLDSNQLEISEFDPNYPLIEVTASPKTYRLDPIKASTIPSVGEFFYIGVYGEFLLFGTPIIFRINTVEVKLNRPGIRPVILSIPAGEICNSSTPVTLQASTDNDDYTSINYSAFEGATPVTPNPISQPTPGEFVYDPGAITYPNNEVYRSITIYYDYSDQNGCAGRVSKTFFNDRKPTQPIGIDAIYCQFYGDPLYLRAESEFGNLRWYDNINLSGTVLGFGSVFNTGLSSLSPTTNTFYVVDGNFSCTSDVEAVNIQVTPVPNFDLNFLPQCEGKASLYEGPVSNVLSYHWNMGTGDLFSTQSFEYAYTAAGVYDLTLDIVYNSNGQQCTAQETTTITVGRNPIPNFSFSQVCDGDFTEFVGTSVNNEAEKFAWDFGDGSDIEAGPNSNAIPGGTHSGNTVGTYQNPNHRFGTSGTYQVTATAISNLECSTSLTKEITILDILGSPYDMSTNEGGQGGWRIDTESLNSSWEFNNANKNILSTTTPVWITNPNGLYNINERSYINSPCISINIPRPAIVIDYFCNTPERVDGTSLEYSTDGGVTWQTIDLGTGQLGTGLNWFNTLGFFLGNVGSSSIGWSGDLWESPTQPFITGRHSLDNISGLNKVRFRIAFASGTGDKSQFDGFAFKNVKIESRNRNLLLENFTQESFGTNNNTFNNIPSTEGTKLQYHIGFPGTDNIYLENTADPSARAAYYGITNSAGLVPRAYIDGYSNGNFSGSWNSLYRGLRSLAPSPVNIGITTLPQTNTNELQFEVSITPATPTSEIPAGTRPVLHAVIIERQVGTNRFVVRKMIPNAAGRPLAVPLDAPITESYIWKPENPNYDPAEIAIVAFIQDEVTKEVYQAAELLNPDISHVPDPSIITSIEDPTFFDNISVYPNPANREVNVVLPERTLTPIALNLMDAHGRTVHTNGFAAGEQQKTIDTSDLAAGLYIIQLNTSQGVVRKKVMVVHEK